MRIFENAGFSYISSFLWLQVCVALVALSSDGFLMCTVDVKLPEERLGSLVSLKFWTRGLRVGEYSLSTVIYEPHRLAHCFH